MAKLVIEWTRDGGYECGGFLTIACVEYESPEAFYVHLEEAVLKWKAEHEAYQAAFKTWREDIDPYFQRMQDARRNAEKFSRDENRIKEKANVLERANKEWQEIYTRQPRPPADTFQLSGKTFPANDFIIHNMEFEGGHKVKNHAWHFDPPTIQLLEEWWKEKSGDLEP